jgi:subtilisin family serine protease
VGEFTDASLFYGLSIKLNQNTTVSQVQTVLKSIPEVLAVYPNRQISKPGSVGSKGRLTVESGRCVNSAANQTWIPIDNSTTLPHITGNMNTASTLKMADLDKIHALGIKGDGMKIRIVDRGIDYYHPSLWGGFGPGFKIAGGYAFVDDNWDGVSRDPIPGADPLTTCFGSGHGTHVSGSCC